mmetsp:Transcript_7001/g.26945  ORF Transcript_7001/g.26945 Transcript_7001/m.26945 type:complete len:240 (+) Transcript_7001:394-1113(+)
MREEPLPVRSGGALPPPERFMRLQRSRSLQQSRQSVRIVTIGIRVRRLLVPKLHRERRHMPPSGGLHQLVYEPSKLAGPSAEVGRLRADEVADAFQGHGGKGSGTSQRLVLRRQERHGHQAVAQLAHLVEHQALADHLHLRERLVSARHRRRAVDRHGDQRLGAQLVPGFLSHPGPEASPATPRVRHQQDALRVVTRLQLPPDCILPLVPHGRPDDSSRLKPRGKHVKLRMQVPDRHFL